MKTIKEIRAAFWADHPRLERRPGGQNKQPAETRCAFVDFVDHLARNGDITERLAARATL